jgi:uncharacterized RDD family membrane protein YckC
MNEPPFGSGPDRDATQPIPVTPIPVPPTGRAYVPPPDVPPPVAPPPIAAQPVHRFGNVPLYLVARFVAFLIDIFAIAFTIAAFGFNAFELGFVTLAGRDEGGFGLLAAVSFGAAIAIALVCEALFGITLGKAIFGLRVRRGDGKHAGVLRIIARYVLRPIDLIVIGPLLALVTPRHQRLGDFASGTVVSQSRVAPRVSILGIALLAGLGYLEFVFGGGIESALGVTAEAASYGPDLVTKSAALVGVVLPKPAKINVPFPVALPSASPRPSSAAIPQPTDTPNDAVIEQPTDAPTDEATADPTAAPDETAAPEAQETSFLDTIKAIRA